MNEDQYKQELLNNGVELPELEEAKAEETETETETKTEVPADETAKTKVEETEEEEESDDEDKSTKKRSIYKEYKDKKKDLKIAEERAERAEKERDEALQKLAGAKTPEEKAEAQDEIDAYAQEYGLDPEGVRKMRDAFLKGITPSGLSEEDKNALANIKEFSKKNQETADKQNFENEFKSVAPTLQEFFPNLTEQNKELLKGKLDELAHTDRYHDKELDYILFKEKSSLQTILTPKKRGLGPKGDQGQGDKSFNDDFDPNADYSSMTPVQRENWEKKYHESTKSTGLVTDSQGRKLLI